MTSSSKVSFAPDHLHILQAHQSFGNAGINAFKKIVAACFEAFKKTDPCTIQGTLVILSSDFLPGSVVFDGVPSEFSNIDLESNKTHIVLVTDSGYQYASFAAAVDLSEFSKSIMYVYSGSDQNEYLSISGRKHDLKTLNSKFSVLASPYFSEINEALADYYSRLAKQSTCYHLREAWFNDYQVLLKAKPEYLMRRSLEMFLRSRLRAEFQTLPEQNVDETHPVDIKVSWLESNREVLIEIKWLGQSVDEMGNKTTSYSESRARSGLTQLVDYLREYRRTSPDSTTKGILAVFDARRKITNLDANGKVPREDAIHYRYSDVDYPEDQINRDDIETPVRFFLEPSV